MVSSGVSRPDLTPSAQAIIDLFRVALTEDDAGMRQLCRRFMRHPPRDIDHANVFTAELSEVLASSPTPVVHSPLREKATPIATEPSWDSRTQNQTSLDAPGVRTSPVGAPAPQLDAATGEAVADLVAEHRFPDALASFGLSPTRSVLFTGPPGVGKTMTATFISSELRLPLITVDIASLMSSFLGRTGQNLQALIDHALAEPSVLLLDEFDAIARSRREDADVGEVRRVVTVLLQQLDRWPAGGLLIAATNHLEALDDAVLRRFDQRIIFGLPDFDARRKSIASTPIALRAEFPDMLVQQAAVVTEGWSLSDVDRWLAHIARGAILASNGVSGGDFVSNATARAVFTLLRERSEQSADFRVAAARIAHDALGMTHREIAPLLGVSHVSVGNYLRQQSKVKDQVRKDDSA